MPALRILLLGPPRLEYDGAPVAVDRQKALALLAYLAVTAERHSREALATLFWPDYEPASAFAYLRRILWALNQTPVARWLEADRETITLVRDAGLWLDVAAYNAALKESARHADLAADSRPLTALRDAVELYRGDFLAGFTGGDSAAFDEWQFFQAEQFRRQQAGALERLTHWYNDQQDFTTAIGYARRWLALDPAHEAAHCALMALYARNGQRAAALRQYEECLRALKAAGVPPAAQTVALYQRIRAGEISAASGEQERRDDIPLATTPPPPLLPEAPYPSPTTSASALPTAPTPFVGRQQELAEIHQRLADPGCRLLTLVGPGGMGKTRLALQVATAQQPAFPHGTFFVALAPVNTPELLVPAIADTLGFPFFPRRAEPPRVQLLNYLRAKQLFLVLDNFEHLQAGADLVADILTAAPQVKILVTSRERLNLHGEWVFEVGGMRFPPTTLTAEEADTYSAVRLFIQSAQRAAGHFVCTAADRPAIARICQLVEGNPLGIELAASWVKLMSCREIADEIATNLDFLTTHWRDLPARHQSLRAVFEHSWRLLTAEEQQLFAQLALFRGGFTREAAQQVAGASLPTLAALVDKSLVRRTWTGRYELHEVLRQYAAEQLHAQPDLHSTLQERHARYYLHLVQGLSDSLRGRDQRAALDRLSSELDNIRQAWEWAARQRACQLLNQAALGLYLFYTIRSRFGEGQALFMSAIDHLDETIEEQRQLLGWLLPLQSSFLQRLYCREAAQAAARRSLRLLEPDGPPLVLATANLMVLQANLSLEETMARLHQSLELYTAAGADWERAKVLETLGELAYYQQRDYATAHRYLHESLELHRALGDQWGLSLTLFSLGDLAQGEGQLEVAWRYYAESLALHRELADPWGVAICLDFMGYLSRQLERYAEARQLHEESLALSREIGDRLGIAGSLDNLGLLALEQGDTTTAQQLFTEGLTIRQAVGEPGNIAISLEHLGDLARTQGDLPTARRYYQESLRLCQTTAAWNWIVVRLHHGLGRVALAEGNLALAWEQLSTALRLGLHYQAVPLILELLISIAGWQLQQNHLAAAATLLTALVEYPPLRPALRRQAQQLLAEVARTLPAEQLAAAQAQAAPDSPLTWGAALLAAEP